MTVPPPKPDSGSPPAGEDLAMVTTVRATYANGVLTPLAPLDLKEGEVVTVSIHITSAAIEESPREVGRESLVEMLDRLSSSVPDDARMALPDDLAMNKRRYLYGVSDDTSGS